MTDIYTVNYTGGPLDGRSREMGIVDMPVVGAMHLTNCVEVEGAPIGVYRYVAVDGNTVRCEAP